MLEKKNKVCVQIMLLFRVFKTHTTILNGMELSLGYRYWYIFVEKSDETRQENVDF